MKILHLLKSNTFSGAENVVITMIKNVSEDFECVYLSPEGSIGAVLAKEGITYVPVERLDGKTVRKAIREIKPDVIHAHDFTAGIIAALSAGRIPVISHLHNDPPWIRKINGKTIAYGFSCLFYRKILTVSDSVMNEFVFGRFFRKKVRQIGNPVFRDEIVKKASVATVNRGYDVLFLGRFMQQKNPVLFLDIIAALKKDIKIKVGMVGDGELFDEIQSEIKRRHLDDMIECPGFIDNPYGVVAHSKVLCIPSSWEGFGLVAVEALSLGVPVVAANVGGLPGIVDDTCGKVCSRIGEYTEEIKALLSDRDYYGMKSAGARKKAENLDNKGTYISTIEQIWRDCAR